MRSNWLAGFGRQSQGDSSTARSKPRAPWPVGAYTKAPYRASGSAGGAAMSPARFGSLPSSCVDSADPLTSPRPLFPRRRGF